MKKKVLSSVCLLFLFALSFGGIAEASGKTQSDITFIQGEKPGEPIIDKILDGNKSGLFPHTGEQKQLYLMIIGICLLSFIYLVIRSKRKNIGKKEQE